MRNSMKNKSRHCHRVQNKKKRAIKSRSKITRTILKQDEHHKDSPPSTSVILQNSQSTGLVYDERMLKHKHEWFIEEQESPRRIQQAFHRCIEENLVSRCIRVPACPISEDDLTLVHDKSYVEKIKQSCHMSNRELYSLSAEYDGVFFNRYTWLCATLAAGSVKHLTELVVTNQLSNGLALIRPPGHHAMRSEACGYCIFNNIAITAASLLQSKKSITKHNFTYLQRILIIDWDVHHGQGTQYAFYDDNRVLYISIHRYEKAKFWPNLREANYDFIGENLGKGYNVNIPLEETGMTDSDYLAIFYRLIMPIATEFNPQLILISCGFDAAIGCPEGRMWLTPMVFGHFVHKLKSLAGGKVVVILEGGYFVDSLAEGIVHVLKALLDDPLSPIRLIQPPCSSVKDTIESCITVLSPYWKSLLNSSQPISTESLEHLPTITWPLVKVITWPETNPQLPRILTNYIQYLLNNHFPAPLSRSNELIQPMTLILMSTSQLSKLFDLQYGSTNVNGRRKRKQQKFSPESLIPKLNDQFHIHFYNQSSSETTTHNIDPIDQLCFTPRMISPSIGYEWFIQHQQTKCNCPSFAINLKGQMVKNIKDSKKKYEQGNSLKTFQTTIIHALSLILMGQFQTLYFINNSFSLVEFIETITNIPMEFLIEYRKRIFRPRGFQMNTSNDRTIQLMRNISFLNNNNNNNTLNGDKILEKLTHIYFYSNQSSSFTMPLTSISSSSLSSPSLLSSTSQIRSNQLPLKINQDSFNRPCRIIVLDLNGIQKIDEKKFNQFHGFNYEINKKMKCE
ncbi:unnamed protein product [Schistosoma rodhaini]|nr:unnamed protein product [Schistosoma rodhaini]